MNNAIRLWWRAVRPFAYPASVVPALLGISLAWSEGAVFRFGLALLILLGALAAHTGANLMNDYVDFKRGVDRPGTLGGSGVLVEGLLRPRAILSASIIFFAIAFAIAVPLCIRVGLPLVLLVLAGFVAGTGYVLPPFSLKYRAMGDMTVFFAFGIGITLGSYMVLAREFSWVPVLCAIPIGLLVAAILHANNMRDVADDRAISIKTLAGQLGLSRSRILYAAIVFGSYGLVLFLSLARIVNPGALIAVLTLPIAWRLVFRVWRALLPAREVLAHAVEQTAKLNLAFGLAMIVGILGWTFFTG
jgi:1,4-dihydroxy-2-naphthoate octaprenyltransferase